MKNNQNGKQVKSKNCGTKNCGKNCGKKGVSDEKQGFNHGGNE